MIKHHQRFDRHSLAPIDEVLKHIEANLALRIAGEKVKKVEVNGMLVNASSLRLKTFLLKGTSCVACGLKGSHFALERDLCLPDRPAEQAYHLNLWGIDGDGDEVLLTHDHVVARALGGKDSISNTQTMCSPCNAKKAIGEQALHEAQRNKRPYSAV